MSDVSVAGPVRSDPTYRAFDFRFQLEGSLAPQLEGMFDALRDVPGATAIPPDTNAAPCHLISLDESGDGTRLELTVDGTTSLRTSDLGALLHHAVWEVTQRSVASRQHRVILHAGAVIIGRRIVLISGPSGSGKSTLVTALVAGGGRYVTDEAVEIGPSGQVVDGLPRPIHLSKESLGLLGMTLADDDVPMPGGGSYHSPPFDEPRGWPTSTVVVQLDGHGGELSTANPRRADVASWLIRESFGSAAGSQTGLEIIKRLATRAHLVTVSGGSAAARAAFARDFGQSA